ncbi:hypothetical protein LJC04_01685 [Ruminococcaceae bacterium OttesenSCG-928-O06]|nr:hypothetical protein [Ruminococcaceae bacterium OttesenSCG-928-O06]
MKTKYRNIAFLAELIVNILVFSIACAFLMLVFGKASEMTRETREKSFASTNTLALVETVRLAAPDARGEETLVYTYDENWQATESASPAFTIRLTLHYQASGAGTLTYIDASAHNRAGQELYTLSTASYRPAP